MTNLREKTHLTAGDLARLIDISAVQSFHSLADVTELAEIGLREGYIAVHALPNFTRHLRRIIPLGSGVLIGGPIGFPSGGSTTRTKLSDTRDLIQAGADEVDMMMNIGRLKSGDIDYVKQDIAAVIAEASDVPVKVIIEVSLLAPDEIKTASEIVAASGAAFIKTGTGWTGKPTTIEHIELIASVTGGDIDIKASGGVRDLDTVTRMMRLGVTRFGINTVVAQELVSAVRSHPAGKLTL